MNASRVGKRRAGSPEPRRVIEQLARASGCIKDDGTVHAASFAETTGITAATISRVLHGKIASLSPSTVSKLVRVFEISPAQAQGYEPLPDKLAVKAAPQRTTEHAELAEIRDEVRALRLALNGKAGSSELETDLLAAIAQLSEPAKRRMLSAAMAELEYPDG